MVHGNAAAEAGSIMALPFFILIPLTFANRSLPAAFERAISIRMVAWRPNISYAY